MTPPPRQPDEGSPVFELFVPGRLCLFGEHSDWAGEYRGHSQEILPGRTLVVGTQQGLHARVYAIKERVLVVSTVSSDGTAHGPVTMALDPARLLEDAQRGGFWSYIAGTAYRLLVQHDVGGLVIDNHATTLPMSKGLSSSAAVCVLVARAFNTAYGLRLTTRGEMEFAYLGETTTPSKCGRMDQACAYGNVPVAMTFDGNLLHIHTATCGADLLFVVVDLKASKNTTAILSSLQRAYETAAPTDAQRRLRELLGPVNQRIVAQALEALEAGDAQRLGTLMTSAQAAFDAAAGPLCPSQLTAPVLHMVLEYEPIQGYIWGGKGVGSQGDGTAQLLCKDEEAQRQVCDILSRELGMDCMPLTLPATAGRQ